VAASRSSFFPARFLGAVATVLVVSACGRMGLKPLPEVAPEAGAPADGGVAVVMAVPDTLYVAESEIEAEPEAQPQAGLDAELEAAVTVEEEAPVTWDIEVAPYETNERVEYFVGRFTGPAKEAFELALERQSRYARMIHERLRAGGLPEDMIFLPLIESWYNPHAYSRAAAVGMWQFMTATARGVGMRVDWWVDDRRDPVRSTDGAVVFLNQLNRNFGSVYLAAAAYNGGPGRISRSLTRHSLALEGADGEDQFFALVDANALRAETRDYVPKLIAAALVGKDPSRYGIEARTVRPFMWDSVSVPSSTPLAAVAEVTGVPLDTIQEYNPNILRGMTPPGGGPLWLRVPVGTADSFDVRLAALPKAERTAVKVHVTKKGDYIWKIARANGLTAKQLNWYNPQATRLKNGNLHAGQRILVPRKDVVRAALDVPNPAIERYGSSASRTYVVKRGDVLGTIARRNGTTVARLKALNGLKSDRIRIGQRLRVR